MANKLLWTLAFTGMIAMGAQVEIPLDPVPFSLADLMVLVAGHLLGRYYGTLSVALYLLAGWAGLPVFSEGGSGWAHLSGSTGGYLLGFLLVPLTMSMVPDGKALRTLARTAAGQLCIFVFGILGLLLIADQSLIEAYKTGLMPFWLPILIKMAAATGIALSVPRIAR